MTHLYIDSILAGLLMTNGVPHFIKGITGYEFRTPLAKDSSPYVNVIWGWINLVLGAAVLYYAHPRVHILRSLAVFSLASLLMALILAGTNLVKKPTRAKA